MITEDDVTILVAMNKIENGDEIKTSNITSWAIMKKIIPNGRDLENANAVHNLKKMNALGLVNLRVEEKSNKIKNIWTINKNNVKFKTLRFPDGKRRNVLFFILDKRRILIEI